MSTPRVHYDPDSPEKEHFGGRVSKTCGAITHHNPSNQTFVVETSNPDWVTCKNCIRRMKELLNG